MTMNLFIILLKYKVSLDVIDKYREEHIKFLDSNYKNGNFIASGPKLPRTGGVIIAKTTSKLELESLLNNDPFSINNLSEYEIHEFTPTKYISELKTILEE